MAMTSTKCWFGLGLGSGALGLSLRLFSRPPLTLVYCQARIVVGGKGIAMILADGSAVYGLD